MSTLRKRKKKEGSLMQVFKNVVGRLGLGREAYGEQYREKWVTSASAPARARAARIAFEERLCFASGQGYESYLVRVRPGDRPVFQREDVRNIFCLDLEEFSLPDAIEWVKGAHNVDPFGENAVITPSIMVIAPARELTKFELRRITDELRPSGAKFTARPEGCASAGQPLSVLRDDFARMAAARSQERPWRKRRA